MKADTARSPSPALMAAGLGLLVVCVLLNLQDPALPVGGLDPSWMLATEFAAKHHLVFGRDFVFTYGPYHYLATHLFDPATYPLVIAYLVLSTVALLWIGLANRSFAALAALLAMFLVLPIGSDALNAVALFSAFLICLRRRDPAALLVAALCAPLALAKYSFALLILPLLGLADGERVSARRPPLLTVSFLASALLANTLAHQPVSAAGDVIRNSLETILGYGRAMQITGPRAELAGGLLFAAAAVALALWCAWRSRNEADAEGRRDWRPAAAVVGFAWTIFMLFKMGFVRHDSHTLIFQVGAPAALAVVFGFLDRPGRLGASAKWAFAALLLVQSANALHWQGRLARPSAKAPESMTSQASTAFRQVWPRLRAGYAWASGRRFAEVEKARAAALASLKRPFPPAVTGGVDAIPWDLASIIGSGLDYRPRPVIQSYSAYTPQLQTLDLERLQGKRAPDTLFLSLEDIDARLPTLATGPSLPQIGRWYDVVGVDPLGLILKRRAAPRPAEVRAIPAAPLPFDRWSAAPARDGRLLMAKVRIERTLAGRIVGFLFREPIMRIDLRTTDGAQSSYRFIPDMARLGVAVSPLPTSWTNGAVPMLDSAAGGAKTLAALRLSTNGKNWAFAQPTVTYEEVTLAPGFSKAMPRTAGGSPEVAALLDELKIVAVRDSAGLPAFRPSALTAEAALCRGWLDVLEPAPEPSLWRARGWGWDLVDGRTFDRIFLVDDQGRLVGAAFGGQARPDIPPAVPQVRSPASGWVGAAVRGNGRTVRAYGLLNDGRACEIGHMDWVQ